MTSSNPESLVLAFDLYGTLLSTGSIAEQLGNHFGQSKAQSISTSWRRYQLEYTWRLNSMGMDYLIWSLYHGIDEITQE